MSEPTFEEKTNKAFEELKKLVDSGEAKTSEGKEKMDKINKEMDKLEESNQKLVKEQAEAKKQAAEFKELIEAEKAEDKEKIVEQKERLDALELHIAKSGSEDPETRRKQYMESDSFKAFQHLYKTGKADLIYDLPDLNQKALMRTDSNVEGGFLIPTELDAELRREIVEISNIRSIARVRTMSVKSLEVAIRNSNLVATYEGETESDEDSTSQYRNETIVTFRQSVTVPFTQDVLMDAAFNIESEIRNDVATAFAQGEGLNQVTGDGVKKPEGFIQNAAIQAGARDAASSLTITGDDVLLLTGDLKTGYDPTFVMNRTTLAFIRTLKGSNGQYLWLPALNGGVANTLAGDPYLIANDMPSISAGAGAFPLAYGDFRRGYEIYDRTGTMMIRDIFTKKKQAIIELTFMRWNTGRVIIPEAITLLKLIA